MEAFKYCLADFFRQGGRILEHKTCEILTAERLRLMRFDDQLIIDSFQKDSIKKKVQKEKYESTSWKIRY